MVETKALFKVGDNVKVISGLNLGVHGKITHIKYVTMFSTREPYFEYMIESYQTSNHQELKRVYKVQEKQLQRI